MMAAIFGLAGPGITAAERAFFGACRPAGFILFKRNIETPDQVRRLTDGLRDLTGRSDLPILIDQEGGRVARLGPPHWPALPAARTIGGIHALDPARGLRAARLLGRVLGGQTGAPRDHGQLHSRCRRTRTWFARHHRRSGLCP